MAEFDNRNETDNATDQPGYAGVGTAGEEGTMYHSDQQDQGTGKAVEELIAVARDLRANLGLLLSAGRGVATEQAGRLRQNANRVLQRGKERAGEARERAGALAGDAGEYVKEEPLKALAIAAGAGLVLGYLLKRTR
jgi:ElaB/YqjD/DUF883 family membrane-anchored ribosome-binding protein